MNWQSLMEFVLFRAVYEFPRGIFVKTRYGGNIILIKKKSIMKLCELLNYKWK